MPFPSRSWWPLTLIVLVAHSAQAQDRAVSRRVTSCAMADSLVPDMEPRKPVLSLDDSVRGHMMLSTERDRVWPPGFGLRGFGGSAQVIGKGPDATITFQLDLKMVEPEPRGIDQRQLTLILDDTVHLDLGSISVRVQRFPSIPGVVQNLSAIVPTQHFLALTTARRLSARLGDTALTVSAEEHERLQSLYVAAVCWLAEVTAAR